MELSIIVQKFLNTWEHAGIVDGVLLTGSRSVGNASENSDIDLQIILSDDTLRERGNKIVDGYDSFQCEASAKRLADHSRKC